MIDVPSPAAIDPRIIGTGYAVPPGIRGNDDPIFDWLNANNPDRDKLFSGYNTRHVLLTDQSVTDIMKPACEMAMAAAGVEAAEIDLLIGDASLGEFVIPNAISELHCALGLSANVWPLSLTNAFSQFNAAVLLADALIRAGRARTILIAMGDNWTRYVDYHSPQAASAADGAAACVMGQRRGSGDWAFVDSRTIADTSFYGTMFMAADPKNTVGRPPQDFSHPYFHISPKGVQGFTDFGLKTAGKAVSELLSTHPEITQGADGTWQNLCLITHQASAKLIDYWVSQIKPEKNIQTIAQFANMVHSSIPFNLAYAMHNMPDFTQDYLVALCLGPDMHANATLLRRNF